MKYLLPILFVLASCTSTKLNLQKSVIKTDSTSIVHEINSSESKVYIDSLDFTKHSLQTDSFTSNNEGVIVKFDSSFPVTGAFTFSVDSGKITFNPGGRRVLSVNAYSKQAYDKKFNESDSDYQKLIRFIDSQKQLQKNDTTRVKKDESVKSKVKDKVSIPFYLWIILALIAAGIAYAKIKKLF